MELGGLQAEYRIEQELIEQGIMTLSRPLRSLFRNFSTSRAIRFHLSDGSQLAASLYSNLGYVHAEELAGWCQRHGLLSGSTLVFQPLDEDGHDEFHVSVRDEAGQVCTPAPVAGVRLDRLQQRENLFAGLRAARHASPQSFLIQQHARDCLLRQQGMERLDCLSSVNEVTLYRHQIETVRRVVQEMQGRALLADEVGLGKTIEAGLCLKEYLLRGLVERFIVFTPASLVYQWQEELRSKFSIDCVTHMDMEDWTAHGGIVASLDTAKAEKNRRRILEADFQLVIVDEAHKLKNQRTLNWKFVSSLQPRFLLLLTATPVQNAIEEIYNLIFLVKPGLLGTRRAFRSMFISQRNGRAPRDSAKLQKVLSAAMVRHRREETKLNFTERNVELMAIPFDAHEEKLYAALYDFVRAHYAGLGYFEEGLNRLTLMLLERMVTSSPRALKGSLDKILDNAALPRHYRRYLEDIRTLARQCRRCSKAQRVLEFCQASDEKVVVYTQFRDSQEFLCKLLKRHDIDVVKFHGGLTPRAREKVIQDFTADSRVLVSTDSGGEGKNLQFCRNLINYDLPWNPMKVEQRIGRVHRLGQTRTVNIANLYYLDSIEEYVVKLLSDKIRLFTLVVGEVDTILGLTKLHGELERTIMDIYLSASDRHERQRLFEELGDDLSEALERYEEIKETQNKCFRF